MTSQATIWYTNTSQYSMPENVGFYGGAATPPALNPTPWATAHPGTAHGPYFAAPGPPLFVPYGTRGLTMQHMQQMGLRFGSAAYPAAFPVQSTVDPNAAAAAGALALSAFGGAETGLQIGGAAPFYYQQQSQAQLALPSQGWALGLASEFSQAPAPARLPAEARGAKPRMQSKPLAVTRVPTRCVF